MQISLEDLQKELIDLKAEYKTLEAPSYPTDLEFSSNPEIEEIKKIYKEIINLDKLIEILDILEFIK